MEPLARRSAYTLEEKLFDRPYEFDFYQAIRVLSALRPQSHSFGTTENLKHEPVLIKSSISYAVPSSDIQSLTVAYDPEQPPILTVNFLGVAGIQGPLPQPYTELLSDRLQQKDTAFRDFLDIFNHRFVGYWYLVEKKYVLGLEQVPVDQTSIGRTLLDIAGFSHPELVGKVHLHTRSLINYAPLFWQRQRSVAGLYKIVKGYFNTDVVVKEFFGAWRTPPVEDLSLLGVQKGRYQVLGKSYILGKRSWDAAAGIALILQNLPWKTYLTHLPGASGNVAFRDLVRLYGGLGFILELRATIIKEQIPPSYLGKELFLGQTSWLTRGGGKGFKQNPEVLLLREQG